MIDILDLGGPVRCHSSMLIVCRAVDSQVANRYISAAIKLTIQRLLFHSNLSRSLDSIDTLWEVTGSLLLTKSLLGSLLRSQSTTDGTSLLSTKILWNVLLSGELLSQLKSLISIISSSI